MPAAFDRLGIRFEYPGNWTLDDQLTGQEQPSISVISPGGAFWSLSVHATDRDPRELTQCVLNALQEEYSELDAEPITQTLADYNVEGYDIQFYCLDLVNTALVRAIPTSNAVYLLLCQAEDREFEALEAVFRAMTTSLMRNLGID